MSRISFGYSVSEGKVINLDQQKPAWLEKIFELEPSLHRCISCGNCAAVCTAGHFTGMKFYRICLNAFRGQTSDLKNDAKACMLCGKCQFACPRGVNIRHAIMLMTQIQKP
ncbi:4Fe-4S dicluster domain-containing protein [Natronoflexus pectinivorans]|uniref:4Fe-4S dicluster protein n=1 Tax=Natronoflexus pectinivorans TaxID=682526 RepID=A0A4R2GG04_9BACT|nr:4Fe-4S dicluster domain-containing protein [Natronoflexus pectinivorans]TCO07111.1 4Fe-4S dicluster protein [Natronoflexus pectinivorans]